MKKKLLMLASMLLCTTMLSARTWHVSPSGSDVNDGSANTPVKTISKAAYYALAGDTVLIHEGVYREWVSPAHTGFNEQMRIVYMAAPGEDVHLKGSEVITTLWKKTKTKGVWSTAVPNDIFGDFNPFDIKIYGDWFFVGDGLHLGEVYLNGEIMDETLDPLKMADKSMLWSAEVCDETTIITASFGDLNPNKEFLEMNVRPTCFYPKTTGVNYITVKGLKISQAATQWSPPTGEQIGLIGPNWSRGWVIENCEIFQSKCVGICLGKERASGHNFHNLYHGKIAYPKHGFTREIEAIFKAYELGWSKENIGSHLVQNNKIYDCNQAGIVGHMGCAFSTIRANEIYDITHRGYINGAEIGGIKLHAAIDVVIEGNIIVNTARGLWLDWQAQGTHVVGNIIDKSANEDIFVEVSHGPTLIYNNLLLSTYATRTLSHGIAYFNNIFRGNVKCDSATRYTPYHEPHSTKVKGLYNAQGGDIRFYNNIFLAACNEDEKRGTKGLEAYNKYPVSDDEMNLTLTAGVGAYITANLPVYMDKNVYMGDAQPHDRESGYTRLSDKAGSVTLEKRDDGKYYLTLNLDGKSLEEVASCRVDTDMLRQAVIPEMLFENPDGSPFTLTYDFYGRERNVNAPMVGPFEGGVIDGAIWEPQR